MLQKYLLKYSSRHMTDCQMIIGRIFPYFPSLNSFLIQMSSSLLCYKRGNKINKSVCSYFLLRKKILPTFVHVISSACSNHVLHPWSISDLAHLAKYKFNKKVEFCLFAFSLDV